MVDHRQPHPTQHVHSPTDSEGGSRRSDRSAATLERQVSQESHEEHGLLQPLVWPFQSKEEFGRMWWLPLVDYIPIINLIVLRGWRLAAVRRMANGTRPIAPSPDHILQFLGSGLLLWTMTGLYALVPLFIIAQLGLGGITDLIRDVVQFVRIVLGQSDQGLLDFLLGEVVDDLLAAALTLAWVPLSMPLYRAAMIRFAVTGNVAAFGDFPAALAFLFQNLGAFLKMLLVSFLIAGAVTVGGAILMLTGIGVIFVPLLTLPVYYWSTAYEYGELARLLARKLESQGKRHPAPSVGRQVLATGIAGVVALGFGIHSVVGTATEAVADLDTTVQAAFGGSSGPRPAQPSSTPATQQAALFAQPNTSPNAGGNAQLAHKAEHHLNVLYASINARMPSERAFAPQVRTFLELNRPQHSAIDAALRRYYTAADRDATFVVEPGSLRQENRNTFAYVESSHHAGQPTVAGRRVLVQIEVDAAGRITDFRHLRRLQ